LFVLLLPRGGMTQLQGDSFSNGAVNVSGRIGSAKSYNGRGHARSKVVAITNNRSKSGFTAATCSVMPGELLLTPLALTTACRSWFPKGTTAFGST